MLYQVPYRYGMSCLLIALAAESICVQNLSYSIVPYSCICDLQCDTNLVSKTLQLSRPSVNFIDQDYTTAAIATI